MISIIIPTYDSVEALDLCLESIYETSYYDSNQIIVVIDGNGALYVDLIAKYRNRKGFNFLEFDENRGLADATNYGVSCAEYNAILIVNDDNVFSPDWDKYLYGKYQPNWVISPNQVEPYESMFKDFVIKDFGRSIADFKKSEFYEFCKDTYKDNIEFRGSTLPIFMDKKDFLKIGGWDNQYPKNGVVADWDFFLKCSLNGYNTIRHMGVKFYHFVSLSTNVTDAQKQKRQASEIQGHQYAKYKWGSYIKHNPDNNKKYL